jgi:hypothetical protein
MSAVEGKAAVPSRCRDFLFDPLVWSGRALQENFHRVGGCAVYAGSRLKPLMIREGTAWKASLPAVLGKPAVRNDREGRGNVGIIRSPVRASILSDFHYRT